MKKDIIKSQNNLKVISINSNEIITKAKYGPSKETRIPLRLNEELAFFVAAIIGDGHIKKSKFQITIELTNLDLLKYLREICVGLFKREFNINPVKLREGRKQSFHMCIDSKSIHNLLKDVFEIPPGRKSHIVKIPKHIKNSNKKIKVSFIKGIMATEGGKRRRGYGLSTASEYLWEDLILMLKELQIPVLKDKWLHKKYKKVYYGISSKKEHLERFMWECRSGQTGCA